MNRVRNILLCVAALSAGCADGKPLGGPLFAPSGGGDDDAYTILLYMSARIGHIDEVKSMKLAVEKNTGWKDLTVVHQEGSSALYRGSYRTIEDAQADLRATKEFVSAEGVRPFLGAILMPTPGKEVGPREWNLENAEGVYTVMVAVFYDMPERNYVGRKRFAADYCKQLRQAGYDAYFFHGPARSAVTIGTFPAEAVGETREGEQTVPVIRDERVRTILRDFPRLAVNGAGERVRTLDPRTGKYEYVDQTTYVIRIPRKGADGFPTNDRSGHP
ncbi:MAG TPA: hypothetical protein DCX07_01615 [Phycisphaerales bacterium]|nr:hypothetical protein [Phycisphaerales bacterium]